VNDAAELETALLKLLSNSVRRAQLGHNARAVVQQNLGAMERTVEMILRGINGSGSGIYMTPKR
jgi:3-deoxy-D-manno-octulosonic-acid transferase